MLQLDVLSAFAICGAGSLVGASVLRPSLCPDTAGAEALRLTRGGYIAIGVGLTLPVLLDAPLPLWGQAVMTLGSVGGVFMLAWALAALAGMPVTHLDVVLAGRRAGTGAGCVPGRYGGPIDCLHARPDGRSVLMARLSRRLRGVRTICTNG
jgi:hypothetical protein